MATESGDVATVAQSTVAEKRQEEDNNNKIDLVADTVSKLNLNGTVEENGSNETVPPSGGAVSEENQLNNNSTAETDTAGNNNSSEPATPTTPTGGFAGTGGPLSIGKRIRRTSEKLSEDAVSGARKKYSFDLLLSLKDSAIGREKPTTIPDVCKSLLKSSPGTFVSSSRHMGGRGGGGGMGNIGGQDNSLMPAFMKGMGFGGPPFGEGTDGGSGGGRPPMNRAPYRGRLSAKEMSTRSSAGGPGGDDTDGQMIKVNLNITEEVKLKGSANAWKPSFMMAPGKLDPETEATQQLSREFRSALNKLTPENFAVLKEQIKKMTIDTEERLGNCIKILFEKAIMEPNFSDTYAQLCKQLGMEIKVQSKESEKEINLKRQLISQCQVEFEKHHKECKTNTELQEENDKRTEQGEQTAEQTEEMKLDLEERTNRIRRRALGTIRFIGALYKQQLLGMTTMVNCVTQLLQDSMLDEESLECVCKLLTTIGARLEESQSSSTGTLQECFNKLEAISERKILLSNGEPVSNRIRFMIMDLLDLRKDKWRGKHAQNAPKTREQIVREVEAEENKNWMLSYKLPRGRAGGEGGGGGGGGGGRDGGGGSGSKNKRFVDEDGFVLPVNNRNNNAWTMPSIDPKKINLTVSTPAGETRLGSASMFQDWGKPNNVFAYLHTEDSAAPQPSYFGASGPMGGGGSSGGSGSGSGSGPKSSNKKGGGGGGGGGNNSKKHYQGRSSSYF
uniref:MIF4G domain-containing protein n=1 Tax=Anopheles minimus TaxID=112268 RepID=A0A182WHC8_9DIPT